MQLHFEKEAVSLRVGVIDDSALEDSGDAVVGSVEELFSPATDAPLEFTLASPFSAGRADGFTTSCGAAVDVAIARAKSIAPSPSPGPI